MIIPRKPESRFEESSSRGTAMLHTALKALAGAIDFGDGAAPPLNIWIRTAPRGAQGYSWRIEIAPRLGQPAGFELGTGVGINPVAPEDAAEQLRGGARSDLDRHHDGRLAARSARGSHTGARRPPRRFAKRLMDVVLWVIIPPVLFFNLAHFEFTIEAGKALGDRVDRQPPARRGRLRDRDTRFDSDPAADRRLRLLRGDGQHGVSRLRVLDARRSAPDALDEAIIYDILVMLPSLMFIAFSIGAAYGTHADTPRERFKSYFTKNPLLFTAVLALLAPESLSPRVGARHHAPSRLRDPAGGILRRRDRRAPRERARQAQLPAEADQAGRGRQPAEAQLPAAVSAGGQTSGSRRSPRPTCSRR